MAFNVTGNKPDPALIYASSGMIKYELISTPQGGNQASNQNMGASVQGVILLQVKSGEKLKVEVFPGKTVSEVSDFTSAALNYER